MPLLLIFGLPILEIYVFILVSQRIGFINSFFAILVSMVLGVGIAKSQGKFMFRHLQQSVANRSVPEARIVHSLMIFIGGVLMVIPGFITTLAGLVFVLPGTRHLLAFWLKARLLAQVGLGKFGVFGANGLGGIRFGMGGFSKGFPGGSASGFGGTRGPAGFGGSSVEHDDDDLGLDDGGIHHGRDVTPRVIDVTPVRRQTGPTSKSDTDS